MGLGADDGVYLTPKSPLHKRRRGDLQGDDFDIFDVVGLKNGAVQVAYEIEVV